VRTEKEIGDEAISLRRWHIGNWIFGTPAHADYALVRFEDGWCRIWWDSTGTPWGVGWTKIAIGMPDWLTASAALSNARSQGVCR